MVEIKDQLVVGSKKITPGINDRTYLTIHETANANRGAGAQAHANLQTRGNVRDASWHLQVDDKLAIRSFPNTARCWHAGGGKYGPGQMKSIAIEICVNEDSDFVTAVSNAAELSRIVMAEEGITVDRVVNHWFWSGKNCPTLLRSGLYGFTWDDFLDLLADDQTLPPAGEHIAPILVDGVRGKLTIAAHQQIMGTFVDGKISRPSPLIEADQRWLNLALGSGHIKNLIGKPLLAVDGYEGPDTLLCRSFLLRNRVDPSLDLTPKLTAHHVRALQLALNAAVIGSGMY